MLIHPFLHSRAGALIQRLRSIAVHDIREDLGTLVEPWLALRKEALRRLGITQDSG